MRKKRNDFDAVGAERMTDAELIEFIYQGSNIFIHYIPFQTPLKVRKQL